MFQTFSGSSRRPRNVNLSGQNRNPFAAAQQTSRPGGVGGKSAVAQAQQERRARQVEREKLQAVRTLQRCWRGHCARRRTRAECRKLWDQGRAQTEEEAAGNSKLDEQRELGRTIFLSWFVRREEGSDAMRVCVLVDWLNQFASGCAQTPLAEEWRAPLVKLSEYALGTLGTLCMGKEPLGASTFYETGASRDRLLSIVTLTGKQFPNALANMGKRGYYYLGQMVAGSQRSDAALQEAFVKIYATILLQSSSAQPAAYEGFARQLLPTPDLERHLDLSKLSVVAQKNHLARATRRLLSSTSESSMLATTSKTNLLWAMANFIHLHRQSASADKPRSPNIDYIACITIFLSHLEDAIAKRQNIHDTTTAAIIPRFVEDEVASLINQESIMSLIAHSDIGTAPSGGAGTQSDDAAILGSYALVLLQAFPRRSDEIRGWLYMSSTPAPGGSEEPAIKYFWKAVERSSVYKAIYQGPGKAVDLLKQDGNLSRSADHRRAIDQEWRVLFLFFELYTFVLKIMDDDEFMTGNQGEIANISWTRRSALTLPEVRNFTTFLKNLAFAMYWNGGEIMGAREPVEPQSLASYFGHGSTRSFQQEAEKVVTPVARTFAGVEGMTLVYMKGMVTGLLRMLYERDSRRHFCNADHWLMKSFDMKGFIEAVVVEQAFRDKQNEDEDEEEATAMDLDLGSDDDETLVGTGRTQQIRRFEKLKEQQQKSSRHRLLKSLTPRLEILQNMPFFIPFATRVEIFRQFVTADQVHRRNGFLDPDQWRMAMGGGPFGGGSRTILHELGKHSARVRREHVFDDAFQQFYELGEGLKEPIQITFVDRFDTQEAGIDGGGVTKEFLTSITAEAFSVEQGGTLFVENDQHLLYPNPSAIDEQRENLRIAGVAEGSSEWNMHIRKLLQQFEFLGRIVGKCLYEGILEDIHFAPFFLVKWALTGGSGAAANESGYRANINDLRDLDEELYQNLLKLKNFPGNVDNFDLDFTITDVVQRDGAGAPKKSLTRELRRGGNAVAVTNANRLIYISAVARHRLQTQPAAQTNAFLQGLAAIIQPAWLSMFNQSELQTLLGGDAAEIDVADLRAHTLYGGVYALGDDGREHPTVQAFWSVLAELSDADRRKVLKYVTSTPRGPLLGFGQLNPRFSIRDSGSDQARLPSTSTCVNLLKLPIYKSKEVLKERLLYAVNAGAGFNLS